MSAPSGRKTPMRVDALERQGDRVNRVKALEDKARTLNRSVGALNRELAERDAERDGLPTSLDEDGGDSAA